MLKTQSTIETSRDQSVASIGEYMVQEVSRENTGIEPMNASLSERVKRLESLDSLDAAYLTVKENILAVKTPQREDETNVPNQRGQLRIIEEVNDNQLVEYLPSEGQWPKFLPKRKQQTKGSYNGVYSYFVDEVGGLVEGKRVPYQVFNKMIGTDKHLADKQLPEVSTMTNKPVQMMGVVRPRKVCPPLCLTGQGRHTQVSSYGGCSDNPFINYLGRKVRNC